MNQDERKVLIRDVSENFLQANWLATMLSGRPCLAGFWTFQTELDLRDSGFCKRAFSSKEGICHEESISSSCRPDAGHAAFREQRRQGGRLRTMSARAAPRSLVTCDNRATTAKAAARRYVCQSHSP